MWRERDFLPASKIGFAGVGLELKRAGGLGSVTGGCMFFRMSDILGPIVSTTL